MILLLWRLFCRYVIGLPPAPPPRPVCMLGGCDGDRSAVCLDMFCRAHCRGRCLGGCDGDRSAVCLDMFCRAHCRGRCLFKCEKELTPDEVELLARFRGETRKLEASR